MSQLPVELVQELRPFSKVAFGQELRLPIAIAIARSPEPNFGVLELQSWVHATTFSQIERPLGSLVRLGAVSRSDPTANGRIQLHRHDSLLWKYAEELVDTYLRRPRPDALFSW